VPEVLQILAPWVWPQISLAYSVFTKEKEKNKWRVRSLFGDALVAPCMHAIAVPYNSHDMLTQKPFSGKRQSM